MSISACPNAVRKMIGVCSEARRWRISAAVSKPSISLIRMSRRISAKSSWRSSRSASRPEPALTMIWRSGVRIASTATSLDGVSSTTRILARRSIAI